MRPLLAVVVVCLLSTVTAPVAAQNAPPPAGGEAEARAEFERGRAAYAEGRFDVALDAFRRSHALSGRPELLFNVGSSADRLRRDEEALTAYEQFLREMPDAPNRALVQERITFLRDQRLSAREAALADREREREAETTTTTEVDDGGSVLESPVFWAVVGVVVIGGVVATLVLTASEEPEEPLAGDLPAVYTLSF